MRKFEKVLVCKDLDYNLPKRKTKYSAGYDFEVAEDIIVPSYLILYKWLETKAFKDIEFMDILFDPSKLNKIYTLDEMANLTKLTKAKPTLVPTGVKCKLEPNTYLELSVRSSCPLKYWLILANSVGIIDKDYYNNPDNEGEIFFQLINLTPYNIIIRKGAANCSFLLLKVLRFLSTADFSMRQAELYFRFLSQSQ